MYIHMCGTERLTLSDFRTETFALNRNNAHTKVSLTLSNRSGCCDFDFGFERRSLVLHSPPHFTAYRTLTARHTFRLAAGTTTNIKQPLPFRGFGGKFDPMRTLISQFGAWKLQIFARFVETKISTPLQCDRSFVVRKYCRDSLFRKIRQIYCTMRWGKSYFYIKCNMYFNYYI